MAHTPPLICITPTTRRERRRNNSLDTDAHRAATPSPRSPRSPLALWADAPPTQLVKAQLVVVEDDEEKEAPKPPVLGRFSKVRSVSVLKTVAPSPSNATFSCPNHASNLLSDSSKHTQNTHFPLFFSSQHLGIRRPPGRAASQQSLATSSKGSPKGPDSTLRDQASTSKPPSADVVGPSNHSITTTKRESSIQGSLMGASKLFAGSKQQSHTSDHAGPSKDPSITSKQDISGCGSGGSARTSKEWFGRGQSKDLAGPSNKDSSANSLFGRTSGQKEALSRASKDRPGVSSSLFGRASVTSREGAAQCFCVLRART